jgi:hypothetical protein
MRRSAEVWCACADQLRGGVHARAHADATHPAHSQVEAVLTAVGFSDELQRAPVATLSGGWKMKLALGALPPNPLCQTPCMHALHACTAVDSSLLRLVSCGTLASVACSPADRC